MINISDIKFNSMELSQVGSECIKGETANEIFRKICTPVISAENNFLFFVLFMFVFNFLFYYADMVFKFRINTPEIKLFKTKNNFLLWLTSFDKLTDFAPLQLIGDVFIHAIYFRTIYLLYFKYFI